MVDVEIQLVAQFVHVTQDLLKHMTVDRAKVCVLLAIKLCVKMFYQWNGCSGYHIYCCCAGCGQDAGWANEIS